MYWFGATFTFACPICRKLSEKKSTVSSPTDDPKKVIAQLSHEKLACVHCKTPMLYGTPVDVDVQGGTPESLRELGFPTPTASA